jgi:hypothetical protein
MEQNAMQFKEFDQAFLGVQAVLRTVTKDAKNPHLRNRYASLQSVVLEVIEALNANGFVVFQPMVESNGRRYVRTIVRHAASSQEVACDTEILASPNKGSDEIRAQDLGSGITYARRYGLMSLLCLAPSDGEDDDGNAASGVRGGWQGQQAVSKPAFNIRDIRATLDAAATVEDLKGICAGWKERIGGDAAMQAELVRLYKARAEELAAKVG